MNSESTALTFWGAGTPRTFRPIWTAEELGLSYQHLPIGPRTGETQTREYTELNRKQKVPFMRDADLGLSESVAICRYLIDQYGDEAEIYKPSCAMSRAKEDEWVSYIYGEIDETSLYVMRRHGDLSHIFGEAPAAVESGKAYAEKHLNVTDKHIARCTYVVAEQFGLADIMLMSCLDWAVFYGLNLPEALTAYRARISERPAYKRAYEANYASVTGE